MLSARGTEYDKLFGFEAGIDDYVTKPFSPKELIYWDGDKGKNQVFEFRDLDAQYDFRKWSEEMMATSQG